MERKGHYLTPGVKATAPGVLFAVAVSPSVASVGGDERHQFHSWGGADVAMSRRRGPRWGPTRQHRAEEPADLHEWMDKHADRHQTNYVVAASGQETAAMCQLWDHIDRGGVEYIPPGAVWTRPKAGETPRHATTIRRVTLTPRCFILDYIRCGKRFVWVGGSQFFDGGEESLAKSTKNGWVDTGWMDTPGNPTGRMSRERAVLWLTVFQQLSDWWMKNAKAPFGLTASALSAGILRTHVKAKTLCTHSASDVHQLERAAAFGGMARTFYYGTVGEPEKDCSTPEAAPKVNAYGRIPGPMHHLDVRSMYPWLLRERTFPRALHRYVHNPLPSEVYSHCLSSGVVARVTIETDRADYPERVGDRTYYRTGRFTTTLTGPELLALRGHGKLVACHEMATYHMGAVFRKAAGALIKMREDARAAGEASWELFAKIMGNGLGGKMAQRKGHWDFRKAVCPPYRYGEFMDKSAGAKDWKRFRALAGLVWEWVPDPTGAGPYTAAFAYLTAYGRLHLKGIMDACPTESVFSVDTDGLWVGDRGLCALRAAGRIGGDSAGDLRVSSVASSGHFFDARHYFAAGRWVLAGFDTRAVEAFGAVVTRANKFTHLCGTAGGPPKGTTVRVADTVLAIKTYGQSIGPTGWATPTKRR